MRAPRRPPAGDRRDAAVHDRGIVADDSTNDSVPQASPAALEFMRLRYADAIERGDIATAFRLLPIVRALLGGREAPVMSVATYQEALERLDDWAADNPLEALREYAEYLSEYRLDCCAVAEPAAALIHADHLLTPERRAWCTEEARRDALQRFIPDRLERERRIVIARAQGAEP